MLPNLTILIACYIAFRAFEKMMEPETKWRSSTAHVLVILFGLLTIGVACLVTGSTIDAGVSATEQMRGIQQQLRSLER